MMRTGFALAPVFALSSLLAVAGCQREDSSLSDKLDQISERLDRIEQKIGQGGAAAARGQQPQRPQRPRPNPNDVYAANVEGAPCEGPDDAKVTVVEAFTFT